MTPADAFPLASELSRRAPRALDRDELLIELEEEYHRRQRFYPTQVKKGAMTETQADHFLGLWAALIADHRRADHAVATLRGARPHGEPDPFTFDWPARIRELRRELAMRRAAYPKWVASVTNPLTEFDAVKKLERLDAVYHRYWLGLFCFSHPSIAPHEDPARIAWAAAGERARMAAPWARARAAPSVYGPHLPATIEAAADARHREACWRVIEGTARIAAGEDLGGLMPPDGATLAIVAAEALRRFEEAHDQALAGLLDHAIADQLALVEAWLNPCGRHAHPAPAAPVEERKAA